MLNFPPFNRHTAYTLWRINANPEPGKAPLKVPVWHDGRTHHNIKDGRPAPPLTAAQAEMALAAARANGVGHDRPGEVGYVGIGFRPAGTGLACLDVDGCYQGGQWNATAQHMAGLFPGALMELSTSGTGLHIWFSYTGESPGRHGKDASKTVELYAEGQFIAAGTVLQGDAHTDHTPVMRQVVAHYWPPKVAGVKEITAHDWAEKTEDQRAETLATLAAALEVLDYDDRDVWVGVGQALFTLGQPGFDLWAEWSARSDKFQGEFDLGKWDTFSADHTDYRAVIARAQRVPGWENPKSTAARTRVAMMGFGLAPMPVEDATYSAPVVQPETPPAPSVATVPAEGGPTLPPLTAQEGLSFAAAAEGAIPATLPNVVDALSGAEATFRIGFDEFLGKPVISPDGVTWRPQNDADAGMLRMEMERRGFKSINAEIMKTALTILTSRHRFDSAKEWAEGLKWDGTPRVRMALSSYFGVEDSPYAQAVAEYLFTGLAGRVMAPGCQADMALILVGGQGVQKTSAIMALAPFPEAFGKVNLEKRDEDLSRRLRGKIVVELPELRGLTGRNIQGIRDWMTTRVEAWVEKFEKYEGTFPRRFLAVGSSNEDEVLDDPEGERRWLPARVVGEIRVAALQHDREQLWAEAAAMWRFGGIRWQEAERLAKFEHEHYKVSDEWTPIVRAWLEDKPTALKQETETGIPRGDTPFVLLDVLRSGLGIPVERIDRGAQLRVGKILRSLGFVKKVIRAENGIQGKKWTRVAVYPVVSGVGNVISLESNLVTLPTLRE